jgi:hypothetical protein
VPIVSPARPLPDARVCRLEPLGVQALRPYLGVACVNAHKGDIVRVQIANGDGWYNETDWVQATVLMAVSARGKNNVVLYLQSKNLPKGRCFAPHPADPYGGHMLLLVRDKRQLYTDKFTNTKIWVKLERKRG